MMHQTEKEIKWKTETQNINNSLNVNGLTFQLKCRYCQTALKRKAKLNFVLSTRGVQNIFLFFF